MPQGEPNSGDGNLATLFFHWRCMATLGDALATLGDAQATLGNGLATFGNAWRHLATLWRHLATIFWLAKIETKSKMKLFVGSNPYFFKLSRVIFEVIL